MAEDKARPAESSSSFVALPESNATCSSRDNLQSINHAQVPKSNFDSTCYTMRTYMLKKDSPDSDSVHPVGYTPCQPSSHYEMKVTRTPVKAALAW
jgi:hypothetical protein